MQERSADYDLAPPTVETESLFMVEIINAKEKRHVVTVDVEGAYLNAKMDRTFIMEIGGQIAVVLTHSYPTVYDKYEHNGKIYLRSKKALYGTIESASYGTKLCQNTKLKLDLQLSYKINVYLIIIQRDIRSR